MKRHAAAAAADADAVAAEELPALQRVEALDGDDAAAVDAGADDERQGARSGPGPVVARVAPSKRVPEWVIAREMRRSR